MLFRSPSTVTIEPEFYVEVIKLARRYGFMVISDFAYADVAFDGYQPPSFLATPGAMDVGVEFTTMSKGYNMAGWRVGFCAGNAEMIRALGIIKGYYDYGMFQAIQIASIVALRHTDAAVEALVRQGIGQRYYERNPLDDPAWQQMAIESIAKDKQTTPAVFTTNHTSFFCCKHLRGEHSKGVLVLILGFLQCVMINLFFDSVLKSDAYCACLA